MAKEVERFYIVVNAGTGTVATKAKSETVAIRMAKAAAEAKIGETFIVFEPKDAFCAEAKAEKVYLEWPIAEFDADDALKAPLT